MMNIISNSHSLLSVDLTVERKEEDSMILSMKGKASLSMSKLREGAGQTWPLLQFSFRLAPYDSNAEKKEEGYWRWAPGREPRGIMLREKQLPVPLKLN